MKAKLRGNGLYL